MTERPACDPDALAKIEGKIGSDKARQILDLFLEQAPERMSRVLAGERSNDLQASAAALHSITGSAVMLGAYRLSTVCQQMERLANENDRASFLAQMQELDSAFTEAQAFLRERRGAWTMRKIAVVEDNADNRLLVRAMLEQDYEVSEYEAGPEALDGFRRDKPDLVLLDVSLPGMDGIAVLSRIRADANLSGIPVIALTAHAMAGDRERFLKQGFDAYFSKPILDEQPLFAEIRRLLEESDK